MVRDTTRAEIRPSPSSAARPGAAGRSCGTRAGVLDEFEVHLIPLLLGAGRSLFEDLAEHTELELTRVVDAPGVTHLRFRMTA